MARVRKARNIYYDTVKKTWYVKLYHGKNEKGGYPSEFRTAKTKKEAQAILTAFEHGRNTNTITHPNEHTVKTWLEYWMKHEVEVNCQVTTAYGYRNIINIKHLQRL